MSNRNSMNEQFTMNEAEKLEEALALLAAGVPLAQVLIESDSAASWLEPLLRTAEASQGLRAAIPLPPPQASLQRMMARRAELTSVQPAPAPQPDKAGVWAWLQNWTWVPQAGLMLAAVMLVLVVSGIVSGGLVLAAERSLPGEPLYGVKRLGETVRLSLAGSDTRRKQLTETFNVRRKTEAKELLVEGERAQVEFTGTVTAMVGASMTVDGLVVVIDGETELAGSVTNGAEVRVQGETQPTNVLRALRVEVLTPGPPTPTPTPSATPTLAPTLPPRLTASPTPESPTGQTSFDTIVLPPTATRSAPIAADDGNDDSDEPDSNDNKLDNENDDDNRDDADKSNDNDSDDDSDNRNDNDKDDDNSNDDDDSDDDNSDDDDDRSNDSDDDDNSGKGSSNSSSDDGDDDDDNSGKSSSDSDSDDSDDD